MFLRCLAVCFILAGMQLAATPAAAQFRPALEFGVRAGVPLHIDLQPQLSGLASFFTSREHERSRYTIGPTFGIAISDRIKVQIDALYTPFTYYGETASPNPSSHVTRGRSWNLPLTATYHFGGDSIRPYAGGGFVLASSLSGTTETVTTAAGVETRRTTDFNIPYSQLPAYIVEGGAEFQFGSFIFRPGLRYTRWSEVGVQESVLRKSNQFAYTSGFVYRWGPER